MKPEPFFYAYYSRIRRWHRDYVHRWQLGRHHLPLSADGTVRYKAPVTVITSLLCELNSDAYGYFAYHTTQMFLFKRQLLSQDSSSSYH